MFLINGEAFKSRILEILASLKTTVKSVSFLKKLTFSATHFPREPKFSKRSIIVISANTWKQKLQKEGYYLLSALQLIVLANL